MACGAAPASQGWIKQFDLPGADAGPLQGLTFGVKDLYQVKGHANACGNPTWLATHPPAEETSPCISALLSAGATLKGMTHMDELAYSLNGENVHYGTPVNRAASDRVPGGSSSGSASVVAWGEVDFAVGSDTAGSVRIPASYQNIFGFRPTHGRIPMQHATPLAPSFDTCGWFARDATTLRAVGNVLLAGSPSSSVKLSKWLVAQDAFAIAESAAAAIYQVLRTDFEATKSVLGAPHQINITMDHMKRESEPRQLGALTDWLKAFRTLQSAEVWAAHGAWISGSKPNFAPDISQRFRAASMTQPVDVLEAAAVQKRVKEHLDEVLGDDGFIALPTAPGPAPRKATPGGKLEDFRTKAFALTCVAGLCGLPQVTLPIAAVDSLPVGLSLIGPRNADERLLDLACALMDIIPRQVEG